MLSPLEIAAALFGLVAVGLTIGRSVWCWPVGLVQVSLYTKVFYDAHLYSQTLLQIVFAGLQIHGWWEWWRSPKDASDATTASQLVTVERLGTRQRLMSLAIAVGLSLLLAALMIALTDAQWAIADAFIAGLSLVAQWLLIHRRIENWGYWIVVNVLTIVVCTAQELWPTVVLYIVFLGMAIGGLRHWQQKLAHPC